MDYVVETEGLTQRFGPIVAINDLKLRIREGEIYGLLGPNGSGKTTLIRLMLGLIRASAGSITVLETPMPDRGILRRIGYMPQSSSLYPDLTVWENLTFFASITGVKSDGRMREVLDLVDLLERRNSLVAVLSGGMRQRVSLACAMVHSPKLLLLDEPTVGVDPQLRQTFWKHFRQLVAQGTTIVVSSHVMDEADRCDRLGFMREGKLLAEGSPGDLRQWSVKTNLEEAFLYYAESRNVHGNLSDHETGKESTRL